MSTITKQCSDQWNRFTTFCQHNYLAVQEGINESIKTVQENPKVALKVGSYAIGTLAAIGAIALIGSSIGAFAVGAVAGGTITACFGIFVGIIAHDAFKMAKNVSDTDKPLAVGRGFAESTRSFFEGKREKGENCTINILLHGTFLKNIPGARGFLGPVVEDFLK